MIQFIRCGTCRSVIHFGTDGMGRATSRCPTCKGAPAPVPTVSLGPPVPTTPRTILTIQMVPRYMRRWRAGHGMTINAAAMTLGVGSHTIRALELGEKWPHAATCAKLERAFHLLILRPPSPPTVHTKVAQWHRT